MFACDVGAICCRFHGQKIKQIENMTEDARNGDFDWFSREVKNEYSVTEFRDTK